MILDEEQEVRQPLTYAVTIGVEGHPRQGAYDVPPVPVAQRRLSTLPPRPPPLPLDRPYPTHVEDVLIARARLGDRKAGDLLLRSYDRALRRTAGKWKKAVSGHDLSFEDLLQVARMGFMHAIHLFDRRLGGFEQYFSAWTMQHCIRAIQNEGYAVRVPVHQHQALSTFERKNPGAELPKGLDKVALGKTPTRLDEPLHDREGTQYTTKADRLRSSAASPHDLALTEQHTRIVRDVADSIRSTLGPVDRAILDRRLLAKDPEQLAAIGRRYGRSRELVRQREMVVLDMLRQVLRRRLRSEDVL